MSKYASKRFWVDTGDRAIATVAQSAVGALTANATGLLDLDIAQVGSVAGLAGLVSVLTSVAFRGRGEDQPPLPVYADPEIGYADDGEGETYDLDTDGDPLDHSIDMSAERGRYAE